MSARQYGDFQTPPGLVNLILDNLGPIGKNWDRVLEPTCGKGNFISGILRTESSPKEIIGIELQDHYLVQTQSLCESGVSIIKGDIFTIDLVKDLHWKSNGPLLVIGNPPWVTNSEMGLIKGSNVPCKSNFKGLRGIEAITGASNFDITEFIWMKLLTELSEIDATIALLCKASVARKILYYARQNNISISNASMHKIDAKKWFDVAVDACLFILETSHSKSNYDMKIYSSLESSSPEQTIGFVGNHLISNIHKYKSLAFIEGSSPIEWRQGIKHDAASVLELSHVNNKWCNATGEIVDVENDYIYPLVKGADVQFHQDTSSIKRSVIVPQKIVNQETLYLERLAPKLWKYLNSHKEMFIKRKSTIYKGKPPFSIFGVGEYSFSQYKVIVSGFYKKPKFIPVGLQGSKPVLCDDTCYLIPCKSSIQAATVAAILNHKLTQEFLDCIVFKENKRPITKAALKRIDLTVLAKRIAVDEVRDIIEENLKSIDCNVEENLFLSGDLLEGLELTTIPTQIALFTS